MKIKIITILLIIISCFMLSACTEDTKLIDRPVPNDISRFQYLGRDDINQNGEGYAGDLIQYYLDNRTNIVYIVMVNRAGNGTWAGFTSLIDTDGTYVTYEEFKNNLR